MIIGEASAIGQVRTSAYRLTSFRN